MLTRRTGLGLGIGLILAVGAGAVLARSLNSPAICTHVPQTIVIKVSTLSSPKISKHGPVLYEGDTVGWCRLEAKAPFTVDFDPDTPLLDSKGVAVYHVDESKCPDSTTPTIFYTIKKATNAQDGDVYPYHLTMDQKPSDPHIIVAGGGGGGGGMPTERRPKH